MNGTKLQIVNDAHKSFRESFERVWSVIYARLCLICTSIVLVFFVIGSVSEEVIAQAQEQETGRQKTREKNQQRKKNADFQKKGDEKGKQRKSGPEHKFDVKVPEHLVDVILTRPTDKSVTVSVLGYKSREALIEYGKSAEPGKIQTGKKQLMPGKPQEWVIDGLAPDTEYSYVLKTRRESVDKFEEQESQSFHTQRVIGHEFRFAVQADSHLDQGTRQPIYERTLAKIVADRPDFLVDLGDTFMTDKYPRFKDAEPQYFAQRFFFGQVSRTVPLFLVLGNHDGERGDRFDGTEESMSAWSHRMRTSLFPNPVPNDFYSGNRTRNVTLGLLQNYYAWQWGDAHFIVLDPFWPTKQGSRRRDNDNAGSELNWSRTLGAEQYHWLENTLKASKSKYKFIFIHHLVGGIDFSARGGKEAAMLYEWGGRGSNGKDEFAKYRPGWSMPIHQLLVKYGVSVVFHGHDHFYAHQQLDGVVYVLVPQPGHGGGNRLPSAAEYGYVDGIFLSSPGYVRVNVGTDKAKVEYVRTPTTNNQGDEQEEKIGHRFEIKPK